jgi:acyl-CoA reductase-like NAD-dependent aldehyde dehydrogenase
MNMYIGGQWVPGSESMEVLNPYDGSVVDTVPMATAADIDRALDSAVRGAAAMRALTGFERYQILHKAADLVMEHRQELAETITREEGKIIGEATIEAERAAEIIYLSAEESKRLYGEVIPVDGGPGVVGKFGFTVRVPCGVVACISPFNFPLHLVCHKVGPALAAGNAAVLKPASDTPLVALKLVELLLEAGVPAEAVQCITGRGSIVGDVLVSDPRIRKISFTGSRDIGERICQQAGLKKVTMELGSNAPVVILPDADLDKVAERLPPTAFSNAGQVCISAQRVLVDQAIYGDVIDALTPTVTSINTGNPLDSGTRMGPMIRQSDANRVQAWVEEAQAGGAKLLAGGGLDGQTYQATLLADVSADMKISCEEVFGPTLGLTKVENVEEAIAIANNTHYGLSASVFTQDLDAAMQYIQQVESGNIHINWGTQWRVDLMPYGGLKDSGFGKEGPKYAVEEMTETKMIVMHL